jgi:serpin B
MKKLKITILVSLCMISSIFLGCVEDSTVNTKITINTDSVDGYDISTANNAFAFDMYSLIKNGDENIFFSPYSIFTTMSICYDGAEGSTKEQLSDACYYPLNKSILEESSKDIVDTINSNSDYYSLETANALWVRNDYPLNKEFVNNSENYYGGKVKALDFGGQPEDSRLVINYWVENKTNDKIKDLLAKGSIDGNTKLIITNAVYFNGTWLQEFEETGTRKRTFYLSDGQEKKVDTMYVAGTFNYGEDENAKILELPYKGDDMSIYIVLPSENDIDGFENEFTFGYYNDLKDTLNSDQVKISLPKFTFDTKTELKEPLKDMGIVDAFDTDKADFTGISASGELFISGVVHQTHIGVNEKGTEAAAVTMIDMDGSAPYNKYEFKADHPFMFFIEDKRTGCMLFMGKVENPEYGEMSL